MKLNIYILLILIFATSCESELKYSVDSNTPTLIINTFLDVDKSENTIILALTGRDKVTYVTDGTVYVYINGQLRDKIGNDGQRQGTDGVYTTRVRFVPGDMVKIEAETADGEHHAWSEVEVPVRAEIGNIDTTVVVLNTPGYDDGYKLIRVKTSFSDNSSDRNYYRISIDRILTINTLSQVTGRDTVIVYTYPDYLIIREDVVLTDGRPSPINEDDEDLIINPPENKYGVFDNSRIDGDYTMTISVNYSSFPSLSYDDEWYYYYGQSETVKNIRAELRVNLYRISETQYYYLKALNIYDSDNYEEAIYFPVKFPSNVENGTGITGISSGTAKIIHLYDFVPEKSSS